MPTHAEKKVLPYTPDQMFRLVAEVDKYPEFLPWCMASRIRKREGNVMYADLVIGFKMVRERFTSRVELNEEAKRIDVKYTEGPFQYLDNHWIFTPHPEGVCVDFFVDFEFRSAILQKIIGVLFNEAVRRMVHAFEMRAAQLYGGGTASAGASTRPA